jgi:hypothetical protein
MMGFAALYPSYGLVHGSRLLFIAQSLSNFIDSGIWLKIEILFDISQLSVCTDVGEFRIVLPESTCSRVVPLPPKGALFSSRMFI